MIDKLLADCPNDKVSLARLITIIQNNPDARRAIAEQEFDKKAQVIGITGFPKVGKSSLINQLLNVLSADDRKVAVLAIDPTSSRSGGAFLGDRLRMRDHDLKPNVFIRSLASRGETSALTVGLKEIIKVVSLWADIVIIETVGAGQTETKIAEFVETLVVVLEPSGDAISLSKSGPEEFAHILAVNKCDKDERGTFTAMVKSLFEYSIFHEPWRVPVIKTNSVSGEGITELAASIEQHKNFPRGGGK